MMKVLYNLSVCQPEGTVKRHGGGIYGEIVLKRIIERGLSVVCYYDGSKWVNPEIMDLLKRKEIEICDIRKETLEEIVRRCGIDALYSPIYLGLKDFSACKVICTIHGLRGIENPKDKYIFKYRLSFKQTIRQFINILFPWYYKAKARDGFCEIANNNNLSFVTVSNHSKYAFLSYFPRLFKEESIQVYYSPSTLNESSKINIHSFNDKYFLIVSAGIGLKNNLRAIMAFDRLFSAGLLEGYNVRVTGVDDASVYRYKLKNPSRFKFMGYVEDSTLNKLYHDAYGFVYPSLNEGFGYPPVEAMFYGVPVAASSFSSISEVCQDAAMYFNPFSVEEIMNRILQLTVPETHACYQERARRRYKEVLKRQQEDLDGLIDYIYNLKTGN